MAAHELADAVAVDAVVVVPAGLDDGVADPPARAVEHVPVGENVRRPVDGVVADAARGAGTGRRVADAHPRHHRVHGALAGCGGQLAGEHVHRARVRGIIPFDHVRGHLLTIDDQRPGQFAQAQFAQRVQPRLAAHGELNADLSRGLAVPDFDADPHGGHIRLAQPGGGGAAHITAKRLHAICLSGHSVSSSGWWLQGRLPGRAASAQQGARPTVAAPSGRFAAATLQPAATRTPLHADAGHGVGADRHRGAGEGHPGRDLR